jgi:hypothetical protein
MAYVYSHTRLDKNEIFYIGIGKDDNKKYNRAFSKKRRNNFWKNLTKNIKFHYNVDIIIDNIEWKEACDIEKYLIMYFGKRCSNNGNLVNLNDGGEGNFGYKHTEESLKKIKLNSNNKKLKKCIHFDTEIEFNSLKEACEKFNLNLNTQRNAITKKYSSAQFYFKEGFFKRKTKEEKIINYKKAKLNYNPNTFKKIKVVHLETKKVFDSIIEGCKFFGYKYDYEHDKLIKNKDNKKFEYFTKAHKELDKQK